MIDWNPLSNARFPIGPTYDIAGCVEQGLSHKHQSSFLRQSSSAGTSTAPASSRCCRRSGARSQSCQDGGSLARASGEGFHHRQVAVEGMVLGDACPSPTQRELQTLTPWPTKDPIREPGSSSASGRSVDEVEWTAFDVVLVLVAPQLVAQAAEAWLAECVPDQRRAGPSGQRPMVVRIQAQGRAHRGARREALARSDWSVSRVTMSRCPCTLYHLSCHAPSRTTSTERLTRPSLR